MTTPRLIAAGASETAAGGAGAEQDVGARMLWKLECNLESHLRLEDDERMQLDVRPPHEGVVVPGEELAHHARRADVDHVFAVRLTPRVITSCRNRLSQSRRNAPIPVGRR